MTDLLPYTVPDGTEVLITWLEPLGEVRDVRPNGGVLPYRMVNMLPGPGDDLTSTCIYSVHTFALTKAECQQEADDTHRRIMLLNSPWTGQAQVVLDSGQVVYVDDVDVQEWPHEEQWAKDNSIYRYVGSYKITLRITAAT